MLEFLKVFYHNSYRNIKRVIINLDYVRPKGERLKTFGGLASGPEPLMKMFEKVHKVLTTDEYSPKPENGKLRPIHLLDICNIIAEGIVVGGVRRSAQIALFSHDDEEVLKAKQGIWDKPEFGHRAYSNNSIFYEEKPTFEQLKKHFELLKTNGEPGFLNAKAARDKRENFAGVNPCAEILLDNMGLCNLTTVNVMEFVNDGKLDVEGLLEAQRLSARMGLRMTCVDLELDQWDKVQKRDRLTGCSLTGWQDMKEAVGLSEAEEADLLLKLKHAAKSAAYDYSKELGVNEPLLITTVKPEGTISQICGGVSAGLHHSHSPYYIRRIRINSNDPLLYLIEELGWQVHNEVNEGIEVTDENGNKYYKPVLTKVIDFPVKAPTTRTKNDVSALEQLDTYFRFQQFYTDHNPSITITVKQDEWEDVLKKVYENWESVIGITFISLTDHVYKLAPYESVDEKEYQELKSKMKPFDHKLLEKYESSEDHEVESDCEGGVCPVR
jgi:adenosylcobalamin-dependent ribonucleoside-triphosphate reductase